MKQNSKLILIVIVLLSFMMGSYEAFLFTQGLDATSMLKWVWTFVFLILLVLWINEDCKDHPEIYRPFDFGFLVFLFYFPYLPYYLIKTRGVVRGLTYLTVFILLINLGILFQWLVYLMGI